MTTLPHEPTPALRETPRRAPELFFPELWASLSIMVMWLAVLVDAIVGPDIVSNDVAGNHTTVPSAVVLALFAFLGTWVVARQGFRRDKDD